MNSNKWCNECIANNEHLNIRPLSELKTDLSVRRYMLRNKERKCVICLNTEWLGQFIPLEVDHADGNPTNNEESNLRLLCPNCHALQPTHKGKNKGNGRAKRRQRYSDGLSY